MSDSNSEIPDKHVNLNDPPVVQPDEPVTDSVASDPYDDDHAFLHKLFELAKLTGDCPLVARPDYDSYGDWLPEPECEAQHVAWRRVAARGDRVEAKFKAVKTWYRGRLKRLSAQGVYRGGEFNVFAFYLALRHFPR